jgi:hypothetical protein
MGRKAVFVVMLLTLCAGTALANGEPTDPDDLLPALLPALPQCPEDPISEWPDEYPPARDSGPDTGVIAAAVRLLLTITMP